MGGSQEDVPIPHVLELAVRDEVRVAKGNQAGLDGCVALRRHRDRHRTVQIFALRELKPLIVRVGFAPSVLGGQCEPADVDPLRGRLTRADRAGQREERHERFHLLDNGVLRVGCHEQIRRGDKRQLLPRVHHDVLAEDNAPARKERRKTRLTQRIREHEQPPALLEVCLKERAFTLEEAVRRTDDGDQLDVFRDLGVLQQVDLLDAQVLLFEVAFELRNPSGLGIVHRFLAVAAAKPDQGLRGLGDAEDRRGDGVLSLERGDAGGSRHARQEVHIGQLGIGQMFRARP